MEVFISSGKRRTRIFGPMSDVVGDFGIVKDFLQAVSYQYPKILTSSIDVSIDSHIMAFKAEESRLNKETIKL